MKAVTCLLVTNHVVFADGEQKSLFSFGIYHVIQNGPAKLINNYLGNITGKDKQNGTIGSSLLLHIMQRRHTQHSRLQGLVYAKKAQCSLHSNHDQIAFVPQTDRTRVCW